MELTTLDAVESFMIGKGMLGQSEGGRPWIGSNRLDLTEKELIALVEAVLKLGHRRYAQFLIGARVDTDWAVEKAKPEGPFFTDAMHVYALVPREMGLKLLDLASSGPPILCKGRDLSFARDYFRKH